MTIGFLQIELMLTDTHSLKNKRSIIKRLKSKVRNKFNVAISEISNLNSFGKSTLGIVNICNSSNKSHEILSEVENFISNENGLLVTGRKIELL